jgi:hypothetical protein
VRVTDQGGNTWTSAVPYSHYGFEQPSSLEIIGLGAEGSVVRIDHFIVTVQE